MNAREELAELKKENQRLKHLLKTKENGRNQINCF